MPQLKPDRRLVQKLAPTPVDRRIQPFFRDSVFSTSQEPALSSLTLCREAGRRGVQEGAGFRRI